MAHYDTFCNWSDETYLFDCRKIYFQKVEISHALCIKCIMKYFKIHILKLKLIQITKWIESLYNTQKQQHVVYTRMLLFNCKTALNTWQSSFRATEDIQQFSRAV